MIVEIATASRGRLDDTTKNVGARQRGLEQLLPAPADDAAAGALRQEPVGEGGALLGAKPLKKPACGKCPAEAPYTKDTLNFLLTLLPVGGIP